MPRRNFLRPEFWRLWLADHPDQSFANRLIEYAEHGIPIGFSGPENQVISDNWPSSIKFNAEVEAFIQENLSLGRVEGPLIDLPPNFRSSPLGAFMRRRSSKVRVIHDLSWPPGQSVNDGIDKADYSVKYTSVDEAAKLCAKYKEPWMAKIDLKSAYMSCAVQEQDKNYLGFSWRGSDGQIQFYRFACLPFGLRSAAKLFNDFATGLEYVMRLRGVSITLVHYLDDYLVICGSVEECSKCLDIMINTCNLSGFEVQHNKTAGPARIVEFLGIVIDTVNEQLKISEDRICEIREELIKWDHRKTASKRQLLSLIGKLMFCARVVRNGSMFTRRLIHLSKRARSLHHKVRITNQARADIAWWAKCLVKHNGVGLFPTPFPVEDAVVVSTDASNAAASAVCGSSWSVVPFEGSNSWMKAKSIAWREMFALVLCIATFAEVLAGKSVITYIDNMCIVQCVESGRSREPDIMALIRALYYYTSIHCIRYRPVHLFSADNSLADAISRLDFVRFGQLNPYADPVMTQPANFILDF